MADSPQSPQPLGFLSFTLHAHLPYVTNHGTWPHGLEWLLEAAAETYLPLLRAVRSLARDGIPLPCNLNLSPILLEQLAHPLFRSEFPAYLDRKLAAAREDEAFFITTGEPHYALLAQRWQQFYREGRSDFDALGGDLVKGFREWAQRGDVEIVTCGATHGYMPLLGTDASVRAQVRTATRTHLRHLGQAPSGIWVPECGYRPAGRWQAPVFGSDGSPVIPPEDRAAVHSVLAENGLRFFWVDTHLVEHSARNASPYGRITNKTAASDAGGQPAGPVRSVYHPYVAAPVGAHPPVAVFARDPRTGLQVWSGDTGYPGDAEYLDFHKKRWPGGHRYWRVTGPQVDLADKQPYHPDHAAQRIQAHASHFVHLVWEALSATNSPSGAPAILSAPFDAELFGHWWFEGVAWLEAVARILHNYPTGIALLSASEYLRRFPATDAISMPEGSWGAGGDNQVWLNGETAWTYERLYPAEVVCRDLCRSRGWRGNPLLTRILRQMCRELLLLESSDWQFLITTGAARDYAEQRFSNHHSDFSRLRVLFECVERTGALPTDGEAELAEIEQRDSIFADIDPLDWAEPAST